MAAFASERSGLEIDEIFSYCYTKFHTFTHITCKHCSSKLNSCIQFTPMKMKQSKFLQIKRKTLGTLDAAAPGARARAITVAGCLLALSVTAVHAAPGSPGTPTANPVIFSEDFENPTGMVTGVQASNLADYTSTVNGVNATPVKYTAIGIANPPPSVPGQTADVTGVPFWLNKNFCNGMWLNSVQQSPDGDLDAAIYDPDKSRVLTDSNALKYCGGKDKRGNAWPSLQKLANALGQLQSDRNRDSGLPAPATTAVDNHVIAAYTVTSNNRNTPNVPLIQLQMMQAVPMPEDGRFVTFSVGMAVANCKSVTNSNNHEPAIDFYLIKDLNQSTATPTGNGSNPNLVKLNNVAANPCTDTGAKTYGSGVATIFAAQIFGDKPILLTGNSVAMQFVNQTSATYGNDGAFDNIQIQDVTPQLDKTYTATQIPNGGTTTLNFIVTNTPEKAEKPGWSLTDSLPAGMTIAAAPNLQNNCGGTTSVSAPAGGNVVTVTNGFIGAGVATCQVSVDVTVNLASPLSSAQTLNNVPVTGTSPNPGEITKIGLGTPLAAQITILPTADMMATGTTAQAAVTGEPVTVKTSCTNQGSDVALQATCSVSNVPVDATNVSSNCIPSSAASDLAPGASIACTTTFTPVTVGAVTLTTTATTTSTDTNPNNNSANSPVTISAPVPQADMQASTPTTVTPGSDGKVSFTATCTNNGPQAADAANCVVTGAPANASIACTPTPLPLTTSLAPQASIACVVSFTAGDTLPIEITTTASSTTADPVSSNNVAKTQVVSVAANTAAVPTLSEWALWLLSALFGAWALWGARRLGR